MIASSYKDLKKIYEAAGEAMPVNKDKVRRQLDRAVVDHVHAIVGPETVDTVRGLFVEGGPLYPGSGFETKTHCQIAVRNPECIKGVFRVPPGHLTA